MTDDTNDPARRGLGAGPGAGLRAGLNAGLGASLGATPAGLGSVGSYHGERASQAEVERELFASAFEEASDALHTSERVKELAAKGLRAPYKLDEDETQELCGSVMRHIERHGR